MIGSTPDVDAYSVTPIRADEHQTDRPQHAQVLGHLRLAEAESVDELADGDLPGADGVEELATARIADGVERIRRRWSASHVTIIYLYRNISRREATTKIQLLAIPTLRG